MLENLRKWYQAKILQIQQSNDNQYTVKIKSLKKDVNALEGTNQILIEGLDFANGVIMELQEELTIVNKHSSIYNYQEWLDDNLAAKKTYYNFGSGRKQVHTIFAESIKDEAEIRAFIKDDLKFGGTDYETADDLVYFFNVKMSNKYPTTKWYAYDTELYGVNEYWATAKQTIQAIHDERKYGDCDDMMTLKFSCLYYLLQDFFPEEMWRLRGFIVDIWVGGGHAMLAWVKEGPNDWIPIETTFRDDKQIFIWNENYLIRNQMLYQIRYSFDNVTEYERI